MDHRIIFVYYTSEESARNRVEIEFVVPALALSDTLDRVPRLGVWAFKALKQQLPELTTATMKVFHETRDWQDIYVGQGPIPRYSRVTLHSIGEVNRAWDEPEEAQDEFDIRKREEIQDE